MSNYLAMRTDFINLLNRTDFADVSAALVKQWFDSSIQLIQREVRCPAMENVSTIDTTSNVSTVIVPSDWLETKTLVWDNNTDESGEIDKVELGTYYRRKNAMVGQNPTIYTREGAYFLVSGEIPAGATAKLVYYQELTPLVNDADEPALAKVAPDLIVRGALIFAGTYFTDDRLQGWRDEFQFLREQVQSQSTEGDMQNGSSAVSPTEYYDDGV